MSVAETFSSSTIFLKICMVLVPLQTLLYIIGFSSNYWVTQKQQFLNNEIKSNAGLWEMSYCLLKFCQTGEMNSVPDWLHVTRFFAAIGVIGFLLITVGVFVCLLVTPLSQRRILHILTTVIAAGTGVAVLVAIALYGSHYNNPRSFSSQNMNLGSSTRNTDLGLSRRGSAATNWAGKLLDSGKETMDPGWAYGLCVAALILDVITTILLIINSVKKPKI
ncbi:uncharacterized protein LOC133186860 [Saccostrea echinata]|uniref:uncharacterized protein LOC133186860 n=1 Tax=Saccostrea echinata TaxID=191078 RepID=UPI002A7FA944|nr:uncharacterized protein LOC133186860 [Saccostrea echinata]